MPAHNNAKFQPGPKLDHIKVCLIDELYKNANCQHKELIIQDSLLIWQVWIYSLSVMERLL